MTTEEAKPAPGAKDIAFGVLLLLIAAGGLYINQDYELGRASRMGPGYMPMLVFCLIALFGVGMIVTGMRSGPDPLENWAWRELGLILGSLTAFATFLNILGLGVCVAILVIGSCFADRGQTFKGALGAAVVLVALCWLIFDRGLRLGIPFLPPILGFG